MNGERESGFCNILAVCPDLLRDKFVWEEHLSFLILEEMKSERADRDRKE